MKKALIPLVLALALVLTACGPTPPPADVNTPSNSPDAVVSEPPSPSPASVQLPQLTALPIVATTVRQATFCVLHKDYVTAIDPWLQVHRIKPLSETEKSFNGGYYIGYSKGMENGFDITYETAPKGDELTEIMLRLDLDASDENSQQAFFDVEKETIYALDSTNYDAILKKLDCTNISGDLQNTIDIGKAAYVYKVDANIVTLFVMAK